MRKKTVIRLFLGIIGIISLVFFIGGIRLINNSAIIAINRYLDNDPGTNDTLNNYLVGTQNVINHYMKATTTKGIVFIITGLCGLGFSVKNTYKELKKE